MPKELALYISIVAIVLAGISLFVDWQQFEFTQSANSPPDIVVCLKSFDVWGGQEYDLGNSIIPLGTISFDLVNRGNTEATVHRVDVFPQGKNEEGKDTSMWLELEVQATVAGNGITSVEEFNFEEGRVYKNRWVDEPEKVVVMAYWPNGDGPRLICKLDQVSVKEGDWFCGYPNESGGYTAENACR